MDTKQIEYILKIAEENNITRAAEKLHLTQPALNQQLLRLERELGLQLFYRSRTDWRPTPAGEIYLENARKMLLLKQETYKQLGPVAVHPCFPMSTPNFISATLKLPWNRQNSAYADSKP